MKIAGGKSTLPGRKLPWRIGDFQRDVLQLDQEPAPERGRKLLVKVIENGTPVYDAPSLRDIRQRADSSLAALPEAWAALTVEASYPVEHSAALDRLTEDTREQIAATNR